MLLLDNRHLQQNLYMTTPLHARLVKDILEISIDDEDAPNEGFINYNIRAYFIILNKPNEIKIYINGEDHIFQREEGDFSITKPIEES
jgi:hypothetical protein